MELEQFFESISYMSLKILPLLGVVLLIYLIIMIRNIIGCLQSATKTLDEANNQLRKLDVPLNTVAEISKSVDYVHDLTKESMKTVSNSLYQYLTTLKATINRLIQKLKKEETDEIVDLSEEVVEETNPVEGE